MSTLGGTLTSSPVALALLGASSTFEGVGNRLLDYAIEEQARNAATAGAAVTLTREKDAAGNTIIRLPELRRNDHAPADRAYDKAVLTTYANAVGFAAEEAFGRFASEHRTDPGLFRQKAEAYADAALKETPEHVRGPLSITMEKRMGEFGLKIDENVRDATEKEELSTAFSTLSSMKQQAAKLAYLQGANTDDVKVSLESAVQQADAMLKRFGARLSVEGQNALRNMRGEIAEAQVVNIMFREAEDAYRKGGVVGAKNWLAAASEKMRGPLDPSTPGGAVTIEGVERVLTRVGTFIEKAYQLDRASEIEEKAKQADLLMTTTTEMWQEWLQLDRTGDEAGKRAFAQRMADVAAEKSSLAPAIGGFLRSVGAAYLRPEAMSGPQAAAQAQEQARLENLFWQSKDEVQDDILLGELEKLGVSANDMARLAYNRDAQRWKEIGKAENDAALKLDFSRAISADLSRGVVPANNPDRMAQWDHLMKGSPDSWNNAETRARLLAATVTLGALGSEGRAWIENAISSPDLSRILDSVQVYDRMMADPEKARTFQRELGPELAGHLAMASRMVHGQGANASPDTMKATAQQIAEKIREWNALPPDQRAAKVKDRLRGQSGYEAADGFLPSLVQREYSSLAGFWRGGVDNATMRGQPTFSLPFVGEVANPFYGSMVGRAGATILGIPNGSLWPWDVARKVELSDEAKRTFGELIERGVATGQSPAAAAETAFSIMKADHGLGLTTRLRDEYTATPKALFDFMPMEQAGKNLGMEPDQILGFQIGAVKRQIDWEKSRGGVVNLPNAFGLAGDDINVMREIRRGNIAFEPVKMGTDVRYRILISQGPGAEPYRSPNLIALEPPAPDPVEEAKVRASYQKAREAMPRAPQGMVSIAAGMYRLADRFSIDFAKAWATPDTEETKP